MRVMACNALALALVAPVYDARQVAAGCIGIIKIRMAPQTETAFLVERQEFQVVGMVPRRPVAILAFDALVRRSTVCPDIIFVAFETGFPAAIFDRKVLPLLDVAKSVIVVGKALAMYTEIVGHH